MKNVRQWLPPQINYAYHVFNIDEYEEIVHAGGIWPSLPPTLNTATSARKASFYAGRFCAVQALAAGGLGTPPILPRAANGLPVWPADWVGSISHCVVDCVGVAVAVAARQREASSIAVDCEPVFSPDHATEIMPLIASMTELTLGARLNYPSQTWLTMVYSLKETLYKLLYEHVRSFMPFDAAELLSFDAETGQACLMLNKPWGDLPMGQRYWLQSRCVEVEHLGECILSVGVEPA